MLQLLQIILLTFFAKLVSSVTYSDALDNIISGQIATNNNLSALIDLTIEAPHGAGLNISLASLNNGQVVKDAVELYKYALLGNKWGDAKLFSLFIQYNGQAFDYADSEDILMDLVNDANGNYTQIEVWKNTTTNSRLAELYDKAYANVNNDSLRRRDKTSFVGIQVPNQDDSGILKNWLQFSG